VRVPLVDGFYEDSTRGFDYQRCINWYPVLSDSGSSKSPAHLVPTPGSRLIASLTPNQGSGCRGLYETSGGRFFGVWGNTLYEVSSAGVVTDRNSSLRLSTTNGNVSMSDNGTQLIITTGSGGYVLTLSSNAFASISDADYPTTANQVVFHDGYFVVSVPSTKTWYISDLNDGTSWNALDFASIVSSPDNITGLIRVNTDLWLFGEKSIEVWQNVGNADFPFLRVNNASQSIGTRNPWSIAKVNDNIYWLGSNKDGYGAIWRSNGYDSVMVSTDAINDKINEVGTRDDSIAWTYQENGHYFYVITITGVGTFCFDETTGKWHERAFWNPTIGQFERFKGSHSSFAFGRNYIGFNGDNNLYQLDSSYYLDNTDEIRRLRACSHIHSENKNIKVNYLELEHERGQGLTTGQGSDPEIMLRISKDGGFTWGNEKWRKAGKKGEYSKRVRWPSLGMGRDWVFEFSVSDPIKWDIMGAYMDVEALRS
jgi:hypothetical protein